MIVFVALGTRGDVQPLCCIAEHMRRSHERLSIGVITHERHGKWLSRPPFHNLRLHLSPTSPYGADESTARHIQTLLNKDSLLKDSLKDSLHSTPSALSPRVLVVFNLFALETYHICEASGYRCLAASPYMAPYPCPTNFESLFVQEYGPHLHSRLVNETGRRLTWHEILAWTWPLLSERWDALREDLSLPPILDERSISPPSTPLILGQPELLHPRPGFWPKSLHTTGFWLPRLDWFTDEDQKALPIDATLGPNFIKEDSFICFDLASSGHLGLIPDPIHLLTVIGRTLNSLGLEGLILTSGWRPMEEASRSLCKVDPQSLHWLHLQGESIDHVLLFSSGRVQAIVHPGGAGTVATALSFGIPQVLFPLHHDQFRSSERLFDRGLSSLIESRLLVGGKGGGQNDWMLGSDALMAALNRARSSEVLEACVRMKGELKDGLDEASRIILMNLEANP